MNQEFEDSKREALARANAMWFKRTGKTMNIFEQLSFELGFGEGRVSGGKKMGTELLREIFER